MLGVFYAMKTGLLDKYLASTGVCTDTRTISPGNMFFALKGANFNGNEYVSKAIEGGASFVVIDDAKYAQKGNTILVDDCLISLQKLANEYRKTFNIPILAITGTNGKTTTKELTTQVLQCRYRTHSTKGNLNNHIGVPLTLLSMPKETEIGIIEMGANHIGEIMDLCNIAEPTHGIITNIGKAHLEGFGSFEGVIQAKTDMNRFLIKNEGSIFINANDELLLQQDLPKSMVTYGSGNSATFQYQLNHQFEPFACINHFRTSIKSKLIGSYNCVNIAAAACIGTYFDVVLSDIRDAIQNYSPTNKRSQHLVTSKNELILDAYNANPSSMDAAINAFSRISNKQKLLILGDMFELGNDSLKEHQHIVDLIVLNNLPAILIGKEFIKISSRAKIKHFANSNDYIEHLSANPITDTLILLKGSRGMALEQLIKYL
ncbi:MAG: UDP-N-acetylmuramoyl-tripeptide--D-alanyl-D-alanine ligase [Flavobacteriales bacterium]|jgi:UDP-N-acetylmuramoyl-tripeptide--D-alanyl-D-alanine ligase